MKNVLCLILVLVFCLSMACPVFAVDSPPELPDVPGGCDCGGTCGPDCDCSCHGGSGTGTGGGIFNPKTGDVIMMWVTIMLAALAALVATVVVFRKKFA